MVVSVFQVFTYLLAVYGIICIVGGIINSIRSRVKLENPLTRLALLVKNQENTIEGIIRNIFLKDLLKDAFSTETLTVIDMDSNDDTLKIIQKLKDEYPFLNILEYNEKGRIFSYFEENN